VFYRRIEESDISSERKSKMNKTELVASMAQKTGFTKKDSEAALNAFLSSVEEALVGGDKVQLIGFGTFEVKKRAEREGRNPQKPGQTIKIPASKAATFKAGQSLKDAVNMKKKK